MNAYEIAGFVFGSSPSGSRRRRALVLATGLVNVSLYIVVFWQAKLYADMGCSRLRRRLHLRVVGVAPRRGAAEALRLRAPRRISPL